MGETLERETTRGWGGIAGLAVLVAASFAACYRPSIPNGGFICGEGGLCPDGFACDPATNRCSRPGSFSDAGPEVAKDAPAPDAMADARPDVAEVACFTQVAGCTPQITNGCDPVCQTRCGCREKCSVSTAGVVGCAVPLVGSRGPYLSCDISAAAGDAPQTDSCAPGLVCVVDRCGSGRCYAFCHVDADCPSSTCTGDAGGGVKICAPVFATCDPVGTQAQRACPMAAQSCYVAPTIPDKTICDCPGAQTVNGACTSNFDCVAGLACVDALNTNDFRCHLLCTMPQDAGADAGADAGVIATSCAACTTGRSRGLGGSTLYGYCF